MIKVTANGFRTTRVRNLERAHVVAARWIKWAGLDCWTHKPLKVIVTEGRKVVFIINDREGY